MRFLTAIALTLGCGLSAQQTVFRSSVDVVPVFATVTTAAGAFAPGLTRDDFVVLDNGVPQEIVSFAEEAQAISVAIILDTSGSMQDALPRVFAAGAAFLDRLRPDDRAMIGSLVYQGPPFTSDKARLRSAMDLVPRDPASPVWFALDRAVGALRAESHRRVIVIYTDGRNDPGRFAAMKGDESGVRARIESDGVMLYAIGFEGVSIAGGLKTLAHRSGGRATELGRQDDLATTLTAIADELHHQYLLGFTPAAFDGASHQIEVRVRREGLTVRARQSYVATRR